MRLLRLKRPEVLAFGLFAFYTFLFIRSISLYWFNPLYTTDDARQQTYPFYRALFPDAFKNDVITESMMGYLAPVHWWIGFIVTLVTRSPVMTGHVVMFIQLVGTLVFLYKLVEYLGGKVPGLVAVAWYLHTRHLPARMTGGLPRGWAGLILVAFLYYLVRRKHGAVLLVILFGILTNPPAAFMSAACYGLFLLVDLIRHRTAAESWRPAIRFALICPIFAAIALYSLKRPAEFGHMASLSEAKANSAFARAGGRFPFVPLHPAWTEIRTAGVQAFFSGGAAPSNLMRNMLTGSLLLVIALAVLWEVQNKRELIPPVLKVYFVTVFIVYFLSREFAFRLYVPDRHLQFPLNTFWIVAITILVWRLFQREGSLWRPTAALFVLVFSIFGISGWSLGGSCNFNTRTDQLFGFYTWLRINTPMNSVIAGNPYDIDGMQLFGMRPAYITDETAHPFYTGYWNIVKKRLNVSFRAYYAPNFAVFLKEIGTEKIDYFYLNRVRFTREELSRAHYTQPFAAGVRKLAAAATDANLLKDLSDEKYRPAFAYDDGDGVLIDIKKLRSLVSPPYDA